MASVTHYVGWSWKYGCVSMSIFCPAVWVHLQHTEITCSGQSWGRKVAANLVRKFLPANCVRLHQCPYCALASFQGLWLLFVVHLQYWKLGGGPGNEANINTLESDLIMCQLTRPSRSVKGVVFLIR